MVKLVYIGVMRNGHVRGVGGVKSGQEYNVPEKLSKNLLKTKSWKKVEKKVEIKAPFKKKEEKTTEENFDIEKVEKED